MIIKELLRNVIRSKSVQKAALASGALEELARPYVAGTVPTTACEVADTLRSRGLEVGFAHLPTSDSEAESVPAMEELLLNLGDDARGVELSVKPSQLGIRESERRALATLRELLAVTEAAGALITLEMQGHVNYPETLRLWRTAREDHPDLGLTLPVDVRRAERDAKAAVDEGPRLRLCIGSYPLPRAIGIRNEHEKTKALVRCMRIAMEGGAHTLVASHDPRIISIAQELHRRNTGTQFEFQMFYGVRPLEQRRLADIGYTSRVLLPWGPGWYEYLMTRVASRPQTAYGYLRGIFDKR